MFDCEDIRRGLLQIKGEKHAFDAPGLLVKRLRELILVFVIQSFMAKDDASDFLALEAKLGKGEANYLTFPLPELLQFWSQAKVGEFWQGEYGTPKTRNVTRFPSGDIEKMLREAAGPGKAELDVGYCCEQAMFLLECASADRALKPLVTLATLRQRLDAVEPDLSSRPDVAWATLLLVFESAVRLIIMMCFQRADRPRREALLKADAARGREKKNHVRLALEDLKNLWKEGQVPEILRTFLPREATAYRSLPLEEVYDWRNRGVHHGVFPDADLVKRLYYQTKAALKEIDPSRNAATDGAVKPGGALTAVQAPAAAPKRRLWIAFAGALVVGGFSVGLVSIRQEGEVPPSHDGGHVTAPDAPDVVDSAATLDSVIVDASEGVDASDEPSHEPPHPRARRAPFLLPSGRPFIR